MMMMTTTTTMMNMLKARMMTMKEVMEKKAMMNMELAMDSPPNICERFFVSVVIVIVMLMVIVMGIGLLGDNRHRFWQTPTEKTRDE